MTGKLNKPPKKGGNVIDLKLRFKGDGGPVFEFLSSISDPYARGERVRQLVYLGLMVEQGRFGGMQQSMPTAIPPQAPSSAGRVAVAPSRSDVPHQATAKEQHDDTLQFDADDLSAIFGTPENSPQMGA